MMTLWNQNLETGIPEIDDQHRELFKHVDILFNNADADAASERVSKTLEFLEEYVEKHFYDEQLLHIDAQYPKREKHKKMHAAFVRVFKDLKQHYDTDGAKVTVLLKINRTVSEWLRIHIMVHDKDFTAYCKSLDK